MRKVNQRTQIAFVPKGHDGKALRRSTARNTPYKTNRFWVCFARGSPPIAGPCQAVAARGQGGYRCRGLTRLACPAKPWRSRVGKHVSVRSADMLPQTTRKHGTVLPAPDFWDEELSKAVVPRGEPRRRASRGARGWGLTASRRYSLRGKRPRRRLTCSSGPRAAEVDPCIRSNARNAGEA